MKTVNKSFKKVLKISVIIPTVEINDYILESIPKLLELDWPDFEILIFTDKPDKKHSWPKTRLIVSGKVGPAEKRDLAIKHANGEILAFLDDDAYPERNWLKVAIKNFSNKNIAAVGGPAVTPKDDGILQKVSGAVFESYLGGGATRNRYLTIGRKKNVDDWPTVNLLVRKDVFEKIGGFDNTYWPGEDTKLCLDILNSGYEIIYDPNAIVYHHRRADLWKHFKQIGNYALHRGHFAKIYPKTSRKLFYFVPSLFVLYLIFLIVILMTDDRQLITITSVPLAIYCILLAVDCIFITYRWKNPLVGIITMPMILFTHIWYGIRFIWGLAIPVLDR